jgi:ubiquitin carboxyl-terminal hydrolase 4/11/15
MKDGDAPSPESSNGTASGNEESGEEEDTTPESSQTRMVEESSEEDAQPASKVRRHIGSCPSFASFALIMVVVCLHSIS